MTDINKPIEYDWKLGWNGGTEPYPIVNPLLKAIIEKDIKTVQILESQGASLRACNVTTLSRVIFHVANLKNYFKIQLLLWWNLLRRVSG